MLHLPRRRASLQGDVGVLDDLPPVTRLVGEEGRGFLPGAADRLNLHGVEPIGDRCALDGLADVLADAVGQRKRRARWRHQAEPGDRAIAWISGLRDSRDVWKDRNTLRAGD